jgi:hypothetical protein
VASSVRSGGTSHSEASWDRCPTSSSRSRIGNSRATFFAARPASSRSAATAISSSSVGLSQPLFDLLSGLFFDTSWNDRLRLLNVSLRYNGAPDAREQPSIYPYLEEVGLEPHALARSKRCAALVDVVDTGWTLGVLVDLIKDFTDTVGAEWRAVARKIRIVGLTWRMKTSPNTWRWQQHAEWVDRLRPYEIKNASLPGRLATYLASGAPKTNYSFTPSSWRDEQAMKPVHDKEARQALALAVRLFDLGNDKATRRRFARALGREPAMTEPWFRSLIVELKR